MDIMIVMRAVIERYMSVHKRYVKFWRHITLRKESKIKSFVKQTGSFQLPALDLGPQHESLSSFDPDATKEDQDDPDELDLQPGRLVEPFDALENAAQEAAGRVRAVRCRRFCSRVPNSVDFLSRRERVYRLILLQQAIPSRPRCPPMILPTRSFGSGLGFM